MLSQKRLFMRALSLLVPLCAALSVNAQDFAREARWRAEIEPAIVVGEPVMLKHSVRFSAPDFLAIFTEAKGGEQAAKAGLVLIHGAGVHPDHGVTGALRVALAEAGYSTLSVQMPVQGRDAQAEDYRKIFPNAHDRIARAASYMQNRGYNKLILVTHSMGAWMANEYFDANAQQPYAAWVSIGITGGFSNARWGRPPPIFDVYGQNDLRVTLDAAPARFRAIKDTAGSAQAQIPDADHYFTGQEKAISATIARWLDGFTKAK